MMEEDTWRRYREKMQVGKILLEFWRRESVLFCSGLRILTVTLECDFELARDSFLSIIDVSVWSLNQTP